MAKSKKGTQTKQNIISTAKILFYENGYNKTGIQDIADRANVKLGTITYYYKKKDEMISDIYNVFFLALYEYVSSVSENLNLYTKYCYALVLYYEIILNDEHNRTLYYEVLVKDVNPHGANISKTMNRSCLDFLNKNYIEADLEVISRSEYGARKELFIDYYEKNIRFTNRAMVYFLVRNLFRLMNLDGEMIENTIQQGFDFSNANKPDHIKFLI
ncbi:TetR family transcriptional regulator [Acetobacterium fimetarium]|uniref:TetR family transcriptional regulator n=1 Tax=Acetobacterium fimetarium TaxID=52691 RepID=A0ABR6WWS2_9FIRM|nr:TetR/AcrR family transcriptional regulator [Acetobacterium fimetarium]MBC3805074.1 TetR family transcriptional regulator [Acetobacterium fimetarium]